MKQANFPGRQERRRLRAQIPSVRLREIGRHSDGSIDYEMAPKPEPEIPAEIRAIRTKKPRPGRAAKRRP